MQVVVGAYLDVLGELVMKSEGGGRTEVVAEVEEWGQETPMQEVRRRYTCRQHIGYQIACRWWLLEELQVQGYFEG